MAAQKASAVEAILTHQNELFEGARSNVFVVEATTNCLLTPPAGRTLSGITKDIVIHEMQDTPYPVQEATIFLDTPITEMFITSTSMHVLPVTILNGQRVGGGEVGPITKRAMERFAEYYTKYLANFDLGSGGLG
jgi:D-alanine transaminase